MSSAVISRSRANTRGEQPTVFSLKSRRKPSRPLSGGWYVGRLHTASRALSMREPRADRFGVRTQSFRFRQGFDDRRDCFQTIPRKLLHADDFHKVEYAQPPAKSRRATSGQHVIWARSIVTRSLRRILTHEDRPRIAHPRHVGSINRKMFGRDFIRPMEAFRTRRGNKNRAVSTQGFARDSISRTELIGCRSYLAGQIAARRDKNGQRFRIMLRLRHHVRGNELRTALNPKK